MISHKYKCIFIHIPRCAGSSVEAWINGRDWWYEEQSTKHLLASKAKELYQAWWEDYFKFAIVRDPVDRMISCLKYAEFFGLAVDDAGRIDFDGYYEHYGKDVVIEHDYRFNKREELIGPKHVAGQVYGNILDEEIDFVAKYERLEQDLKYVGERIGLAGNPAFLLERSERPLEKADLDAASRAEIERMFRNDMKRFEYPSSVDG